jgi:hypothetical protein
MVPKGYLASMEVKSSLFQRIVEAQKDDKGMAHIRKNVESGKAKCFTIDKDGVIWFGKRIVVPKLADLRRDIIQEAHDSLLSIHPGSSKMYQDLKQRFWWTRMKREIARFVAKCDVCQRVKSSHLKPAGTLQPLPIPSWKWEDIGMDFIVGLPKTSQGYDSI